MRKLKETDYAYFAGLIDADGSIHIDRFKDKRKKHGLYTYALRVKIGQSDIEAIKWLSETFGGTYRYYQYDRPGAYNKKGLYYWCPNNQKAAFLLEKSLPYLQIKKEQAKLAIKFAKMLTKSAIGIKLTVQQRELRETCAVKMRFLNQRKVA